jgi:hypothetical protein
MATPWSPENRCALAFDGKGKAQNTHDLSNFPVGLAAIRGSSVSRRRGCEMRITRKIRPGAAMSEHADNDTTSAPSIIRLGSIAELVEGGGNVHADGNESNLFGQR